MFKDMCLLKLRMLEYRKAAYDRVITQAHDGVSAATMSVAKSLRFMKQSEDERKADEQVGGLGFGEGEVRTVQDELDKI